MPCIITGLLFYAFEVRLYSRPDAEAIQNLVSLLPASMDAEKFMEQMDSLWFVHNIFMPPPCNPASVPSMDVAALSRSSSEKNPNMLDHQPNLVTSPVEKSKPPELPEQEPKANPRLEHDDASGGSRLNRRKKMRRRREGVNSQRATELELKGFLDLGFSFGGGMVDERLVSIIPGLQREKSDQGSSGLYSSPYLSGAWLCRIPLRNEDEFMKEDLKSWAHAVACSVR